MEKPREHLGAFVAEVFASRARKDRRRQGDCHLQGLMPDGWRTSIRPIAERLRDGNMRALRQFVGQSPRDHAPVLRRIVRETTSALAPEEWVIDDTSFPKAGELLGWRAG
ncbi:transposase [Kitasatospora sp. NPDC056181]|uniref:transposase n=1 Tax=Kitasatospora sp. NPDC056181 TaxID=3345737 RepID=UPI0035DB3925